MERSKKVTETVLKEWTNKRGELAQDVVKVSIYYNAGGMNFYNNYKSETRGYYLSVKRVTREKSNGFTSESYMMFNSGLKHLLEATSKYSAKKLAEITAPKELVEEITKKVIEMTEKDQVEFDQAKAV